MRVFSNNTGDDADNQHQHNEDVDFDGTTNNGDDDSHIN